MSNDGALLDALEQSAVLIAREVGAMHRDALARGVEVQRKGAADIVTDLDMRSEARIVERVAERHPDHTVLGEEGAAPRAGAPIVWIVDPLDGTKNFTHGYLRTCVSIAAARGNDVLVAAVFNPHADEMFVAVKGRGARRNDVPIRVSATRDLSRALVATAIVYQGREAEPNQLARILRIFREVEAVRSDGCAALDLCDVACGRFDAYVEPGLKPWDSAAGALVVREAGGRVSRHDGAEHDPYAKDMLATNGVLHEALRAIV